MSAQRILCVHEEPGELEELSEVLELHGYDVVPAANGGKALDMLRSQPIDGVVLDYHVGTPSGIALRSRIRHQRPDIPILMFDDVQDVVQLPLEVFRAYLSTPEPPDLVFAHMEN
jgi:CheY-like chemotaxis protein